MFRTILAVLVATFAVVAGVPAVLAADQDVEQLHKLVSRDEMLVDKNDDKLQIPDDDAESADLEEVDEEEVDEEGRRRVRYCRCNRITKKCTGIYARLRNRRTRRIVTRCVDRKKYMMSRMCKACAKGCLTKKSKKSSEQLEALNLDSDDTDDDTEEAGPEEVDEEEVNEEEVDEEEVDEEEVDEEEVDEESRKYCRCNRITKKCTGIVKTYRFRPSRRFPSGRRVKRCVKIMPVAVCKTCANVCPKKKKP